MGWLLDWVPLWVWIILAVVALITAQRMIGWRGMAAVGAAILTLGFYRAGRKSGSATERAKQAAKEKKAREERLEMHREATEAERKAGELTDEEARKEAMRWSRDR